MGRGRFLSIALILLTGVLSASAQSLPGPQEIVSKVTETQKAQAKLLTEIADLQSRLLSETQRLRSWSASNVDGRLIEWPMTAAEVELGFFSHDVVARTETSGIGVRCQFTAGDDTKDLKMKFPPGKQFVCVGRIASIAPSADKTVITLREAKVIDGQAKSASEPSSAAPPTLSTSNLIENFFGSRYEVIQLSTSTHVISRKLRIFSIDAEFTHVVSEIDRFGKWLQTAEGEVSR